MGGAASVDKNSTNEEIITSIINRTENNFTTSMK